MKQCTIEVAFLFEDEVYFTEYVTLAADPAKPESVQKAKDEWARATRNRWNTIDVPKWCVMVTDHYTLAEIMEGVEGWQPKLAKSTQRWWKP